LKAIANLGSFDCRDRNGVPGAKISEHGRANAVDVHSSKLANGKVLELTDPRAPEDLREDLRKSMCVRFTTVLGPGSDGYHEDPVHVDIAERRRGYRICQWDVLEPEQKVPTAASKESVPSPPVIPAERSDRKHQGHRIGAKKPNV
jgi:hypothetical protein